MKVNYIETTCFFETSLKIYQGNKGNYKLPSHANLSAVFAFFWLPGNPGAEKNIRIRTTQRVRMVFFEFANTVQQPEGL